jgi:hypothetical protein
MLCLDYMKMVKDIQRMRARVTDGATRASARELA